MTEHISGAEETVATIRNAAGIILGLSDNRVWIDGDLMHTQTVNLPTGVLRYLCGGDSAQDHCPRAPANDDFLC